MSESEEFSVGDRVVVIKDTGLGTMGVHGTVIEVSRYSVGVVHDTFINGHDCDGHCEPGYGFWYFSPLDELEVVNDEPVNVNSSVASLFF